MQMQQSVWMSVSLAAVLAGSAWAAEPVSVTREKQQMSMPVTMTVWAKDRPAAEKALDAGFAELDRLEQIFSVYRQGSTVSRVNQLAASQPVKVEPEVIKVIAWARRISEITRGAFDITIAPVEWEYGFGHGDFRVPGNTRIDQVKTLVNYKYVETYPKDHTVLFKRDGVQIDLGGIAKSHMLNSLRQVVRRQGVPAALVNLGGDVVVVGRKPDGSPWQVGVRHPREADRLLAAIPLEQGKILSSGDYERFFEVEGERYHHILDAKTGKPITHSIAATLLLPEKPLIDLPSVVLMLMLPEQAVALVQSIPGAECLILDRDKKVWLSKGWQDKLQVQW